MTVVAERTMDYDISGQVQHNEGEVGEGGGEHDERARQLHLAAVDVGHRRQPGAPPEEAEGGQRARDRAEGRKQGTVANLLMYLPASKH